MLKGKRVLTENYFGTVLNEAEKEQALILLAIRERNVRYNNSIIAQMAGAPPVMKWWEVIRPTVIIIPWGQAGAMIVHEKMPKSLYAHALK